MDEIEEAANQPITWERWIYEKMIMEGVPWYQAREAIASTMLENPGDHWSVMRTRSEWLAIERDS